MRPRAKPEVECNNNDINNNCDITGLYPTTFDYKQIIRLSYGL